MRQRHTAKPAPGSAFRPLRRAAVAGAAVTAVALGAVLATGGQANAIVPAVANTGVLTVTNLDGLPNWPMSKMMVFNRIQTKANSAQAVHDTAVTRLSNTGKTAIKISKLTFKGPFALVSPPKLPATIAPGGHLDLKVKFTSLTIGSKGQLETGSLTVASNAGTSPTAVISLHGWWQNLSEHSLEPLIPKVKSLFGLFFAVPSNMDGIGEVKAFSSDEVLSPYWTRKDKTKPVTVNEIAAFHTYPQANALDYFYKGHSGTLHAFSTSGAAQAQSLLPRTASSSTPTAKSSGSFSPAGTFGLKVDLEFSDPKLNEQSVDRSKGCNTTLCGNHVRAFQLHNASGSLRGGSYLIIEDAGGVNYDYNDNVYILNNVKPAS